MPQACRRLSYFVLAGAAVLLLAVGCERPSPDPEGQIRALLAEAERAAEAGEHQRLGGWVAQDYSDREGRDRRSLLFTVRGLLLRFPRLELVVTVREIDLLSPQLARVRLDVLAGGAGAGGLSADAFPMELSLRDEGDGWKLTRAEWGRRAAGGI